MERRHAEQAIAILLEEKNKLIAQLQVDTEELERKNVDLSAQCSLLRQQLTDAESAHEAEITELRKQLMEKETLCTALELDKTELLETVDSVRNEIRQCKARNEALAADVLRLSQELQQSRVQAEVARREAARCNAELAVRTAEMRRYSGADALLLNLREETASLHAGAEARDTQLADARRAIAALERSLADTRLELERARAEQATQVADAARTAAAQLVAVGEQLAAARADVDRLQVALEREREGARQRAAELQSAADRLRDVEARAAAAEQRVEALHSDAAAVRACLADLLADAHGLASPDRPPPGPPDDSVSGAQLAAAVAAACRAAFASLSAPAALSAESSAAAALLAQPLALQLVPADAADARERIRRMRAALQQVEDAREPAGPAVDTDAAPALDEGIASQRSHALGELRALRAAHDAAVEQVTALQAERAHLLEAFDVTSAQLAQVSAERDVLRRRCESAEAALHRAELRVAQLQAELDATRARLAELRTAQQPSPPAPAVSPAPAPAPAPAATPPSSAVAPAPGAVAASAETASRVLSLLQQLRHESAQRQRDFEAAHRALLGMSVRPETERGPG